LLSNTNISIQILPSYSYYEGEKSFRFWMSIESFITYVESHHSPLTSARNSMLANMTKNSEVTHSAPHLF
jgi:hypothetical protein